MTAPQCVSLYMAQVVIRSFKAISFKRSQCHIATHKTVQQFRPNLFIIKKHVSIASKTSEMAVMQEMGRIFNSSIISDIACGWSVLRHTHYILVPNWLLLRIRPYQAPRTMFY
jgi:hypothetical protein